MFGYPVEEEKIITKRVRPSYLYFMLSASSSCIHLGFAAYMITSFMLAYNGIMSVLLLQASRAPDGKLLVFVKNKKRNNSSDEEKCLPGEQGENTRNRK